MDICELLVSAPTHKEHAGCHIRLYEKMLNKLKIKDFFWTQSEVWRNRHIQRVPLRPAYLELKLQEPYVSRST